MPRQNIIKGTDPQQQLLLPIDMRDWLPSDDVVYAITDTLALLDLTEFYKSYREDGIGGSFFDPISLLGILMYATVRGERSSRKIELACRFDIGYRIAGQNIQPDHTTIFRFKQRFAPQIRDLFKQFSRLIIRSGVTTLGIIALDGTKMGCNASLSANRTARWLSQQLTHAMIDEFERGLQQDDHEEKEDQSRFPEYRLPDELATREKRLERLKAAYTALLEEQNEEVRLKEQEIANREAEERESGKRKRGRPPKPPACDPLPTSKVNITDPESQIMKSKAGYLQGYNIQFMANIQQFIIAAEVTNDQNDVDQLTPMVTATMNLIGDDGEAPVPVLVADAGYYSATNVLSECRDGPTLLIATKKERNSDASTPQSRLLSDIDDICRPRCDVVPAIPLLASLARVVWELFLDRESPAHQQEITREVMNARMAIPSNRELYRKRKWMVESVNGNLKNNLRFTRFHGKGLQFCRGELALTALTMNILKAWNLKVLPDILDCQKRQKAGKRQWGVSGSTFAKGIWYHLKAIVIEALGWIGLYPSSYGKARDWVL